MKKYILAGTALATVAFIIAAATAYSNYVVTRVNDSVANRVPKPFDEGHTVRLAERTVHVWQPDTAKPAPLVIYSHGFGSCGTEASYLTSAMAKSGYVVVAPDHKDAACGIAALAKDKPEFKAPQKWTSQSFADRREDIDGVIEALKASPDFKARIDWTNVVLAGSSLGSYTALGVSGAWPDWRVNGIKGVLALSAVCAPFGERHGLNTLKVPVMYQTGTLDTDVKGEVMGDEGCYAQTGSPKAYVELDQAGRDAWTDRQPLFRPLVIKYSLAFLDQVTGRPGVHFEGDTGVAELRSRGLFTVQVSSQ